jgi:hypothetical protein
MLFMNGAKIGEIMGTMSPRSIDDLLQRHVEKKPEKNPAEKKPAVNRFPRLDQVDITSSDKTTLRGCVICMLEAAVQELEFHPKTGKAYLFHTIDLRNLIPNRENCIYCRFILQSICQDPASAKQLANNKIKLKLSTTRRKGLAWITLNALHHRTRILQLRPEEEPPWCPSWHFAGRIVADHADFDLYRSWFRLCSDSHGGKCQEGNIDGEQLGLRLINISRRCVITAPQGARYAALSYVWGVGAKQLKLTAETAESLGTVGCLSHENHAVPKTVLDAMKVVELMELGYLWIDALCIRQDDAEDQSGQIDRMDHIYSCASLTIVSTAPDSDSAIPGQSSRPAGQETCKVGSLNLVNSLSTLEQALAASSWDSRGWTLQEKTFSTRLLIFTQSQAYWHCNSAVYAEDTVLEDPNASESLENTVYNYEGSSTSQYKVSPNRAAWDRYKNLVESYMPRKLSFEDDTLRAFAGVLNSLRPELGEHFWGLPTFHFGQAQQWIFTGHAPMNRRSQFPSWSWAGWRIESSDQIDSIGGSPTTIWWWRVSDSGQFVRIYDSRKPEPEYTNAHFGVVSDRDPPRLDDVSGMGTDDLHSLKVPLSHILRFWTSTATVTIGRKPWGKTQSKRCSEYGLYAPGKEQPISRVYLENEWRNGKGDQFEAIFMFRTEGKGIFDYDISVQVMVIEWIDGIAYRVQMCNVLMRWHNWQALGPQFKLITLA